MKTLIVHYTLLGKRRYKIIDIPSGMDRKTESEFIRLEVGEQKGVPLILDSYVQINKIRKFRKRKRKRR